MWFFKLNSILGAVIWLTSLSLWLMPEPLRWEWGLFPYYQSTFLELPFLCILLGSLMIFFRQKCESPKLYKAAMLLCWSYGLFPVLTSALLIVMTLLGITGY